MRGIPLEAFLSQQPPAFPLAVTSLAERVVDAHSGDARHDAAWQAQTQRQLARLYPSPLRVTSTNYDPLPAWRMGVQMAAINLQTNDLPTQVRALRDSFFSRRGTHPCT